MYTLCILLYKVTLHNASLISRKRNISNFFSLDNRKRLLFKAAPRESDTWQ